MVDELVLAVVGLSVTIVGMLGGSLYWLGGKFREIDLRFNAIDEKFRQIDERFKHIDERFKQIDDRFRQIDERFKQMDERFSAIDERLNKIDGRISELNKLNNKINRLTEAITDYQEFFIEYLSAEGLLKPEKASMLRNEARRILKLGTLNNPLSKDEWKRLSELLDKDDLTYDEAIELRELARKIIKEYGEYPEAWKLHIYASIMVGRALRKMSEEGGKK